MESKCYKCGTMQENIDFESGHFVYYCEKCGHNWIVLDDREPPDRYPDYEMDNFKEDMHEKAEGKYLDTLTDNRLEGR